MQTVTQAFTDHVKGPIRKISRSLRISFDKSYDSSTQFFTLDQSQLDGPDVLKPDNDNPLQQWDYYKYSDFTDRVVSMEWSRQLEFPYSVISAIADLVLDNHDGYFTPGSPSPIAQYIVPKRPLRLLAGYNNMNLPQFVGMTEKMPEVDDKGKTASFHGIDFLSQMFTMQTNQTIAMQNVTTDVVLAALFDQFGMTSNEYSLPTGRNTIPFVFFEKGSNAGDVIRQLMQAEMGNLWLDEAGVIQMLPRVRPVQTPVWTFDNSNVIDVRTSTDSQLINTVKIYADIREVQPYQVVFSKTKDDSNLFVIQAGQSRQFEADLQDPALSIATPTFGLGSGASWFTVAKADGTAVTSGMTVGSDWELRTNTYVFTVTNSHSFDVNIDQMELWGQPAKVVDHIEYVEVDGASEKKYEEQVIEITNNFIQSIDQCDSLAQTILLEFSDYADQLELEIKSNFALQLGDVVTLNVRTYSGNYKVIKNDIRLQKGSFTQNITVRKAANKGWFILDQSQLDGPDVLTP